MHRVRRPWLPAQCKASLVPHPCPGPTAMLPATLGDVHMRQIRKLDSMYICVNCKIKKKPEKEITDSLAELPGSPSVFLFFVRKGVTYSFQLRCDPGSIIRY